MRRGQHPVGIVLIFVVLVLVLMLSAGILIVLRDKFSSAPEDASCAAQIIASSTVTKYTKELAAPKIVCPSKKVYVTSDQAVPAVADNMKRCWGLWGKGEVSLFKDGTGTYCHVCSMVWVTDKKPLVGLPEYLDTHKANNDQTYSQYLSGATSGTYFSDSQHPEAANMGMSTEQPLAVMFIYAKGLTNINKVRNYVVQPGVGVAVGTGAGVMAAGGVIAATGVGFPVGAVIFVTGAAIGAATGLLASVYGRASSDTMAVVVVRPLTEQSVRDLGCTYAPVGNS